MYEDNMNLKDYLVNSFKQQASDVLTSRIRDINININNAEQLINDYQKQISTIQDDIFSYPEYLNKLNEYRALIKEINDDFELAESDLHKRQRDLQDKYLVLSKMVNDYYQRFLIKLDYQSDYLNTLGFLDDLVLLLKTRIYNTSIETRPIKKDIEELEKVYQEKLTIKIDKENKYSEESLHLVNTLIASIKADLNNKIDKLTKDINTLTNYKEELNNTLNDLIYKHQCRIERYINESLFANASNDIIINQTNNLINEVLVILNNHPSYEEEIREKRAKKQKITSRINEIKEDVDKYLYQQALNKHYLEKLNEYNLKLKPINDFTFQYQKLINQSSDYSKIHQTYVAYLTEMNNNQALLQDLDKRYAQALRDKNNLSFKPAQSVEQELLNNQKEINEIDEDKYQLHQRQKELSKLISEFEKDIENNKLINLYKKINIITKNHEKLLQDLELIQTKVEESNNQLQELQKVYDEYLKLQEELKNI